jgi:glycosyltransferase involved in cell wall biosynthesis
VGTVYHGVPATQFTYRSTPGQYLAFLGRIAPEKGVDRAIRIAQRVRMPLKIAAKIGVGDQPYFDAIIAPLLRDPLVEYLGEISEPEKDAFLGQAAALLFPISWPEPFGLVLIEAMACGTPIIAYRHGSVPEIMVHEQTGWICTDEDAAVAAVTRVGAFPRSRPRAVFDARYTAARMAQDYLRVYARLVSPHRDLRAPGMASPPDVSAAAIYRTMPRDGSFGTVVEDLEGAPGQPG